MSEALEKKEEVKGEPEVEKKELSIEVDKNDDEGSEYKDDDSEEAQLSPRRGTAEEAKLKKKIAKQEAEATQQLKQQQKVRVVVIYISWVMFNST